MTTEKNKQSEFWSETKDNISEGAKIVEEEARDLSEKIYEYSEVIFGKIKERTSDLLKSGKELTKEAVNNAQEIAVKYRDQNEIKKLNEEKKKVAAQLGMNFYLILKNNDNKVPSTILRRKAIKETLREIQDLDQQILDLKKDE